MDERLTPDELRGLLGAFALGAIDDDEREQVEEFVLDDRDARAELHQLEHAVAWLGHASPRPSEQSWNSVRAVLAADLADSASESAAAPVDRADHEDAVVIPLATFESRRTRLGWRKLTAVAASAVIVVGTGIAVARVVDKDSSHVNTRTVALAAPGGGDAVVASIAADGSGTIKRSNLPTAPAGHVYQLWAQPTSTGSMQSAGLLGRSPAGQHIHIPEHAVRVAISVEPTGGSPAPTTTPVAVSGVL